MVLLIVKSIHDHNQINGLFNNLKVLSQILTIKIY